MPYHGSSRTCCLACGPTHALALSLCLALCLALWAWRSQAFWDALSPVTQKQLLYELAGTEKVDPLLLAAIIKSEAATVKQIDGLQALMKGSNDATNDKIGSLMSRLDRGEGVWRGSSDTRTERRLDLGSTLGIAGLAVSIIAVVMVVISHLAPAPAPSPAIVTPTVPTQPR